MANGEITLVINTPFGSRTRGDGYAIRAAAVRYGLCHMTTLAGAQALVAALERSTKSDALQTSLAPIALQDC